MSALAVLFSSTISALRALIAVKPGPRPEPVVDVMRTPSTMSAPYLALIPPIRAPVMSDWSYSICTPGMYCRSSPMLPSERSPNTSEATMFFTFMAARCSIIALALPSSSAATVSWLMVTTSSPVRPAWSSKLRVATCPGSVVTTAVSVR